MIRILMIFTMIFTLYAEDIKIPKEVTNKKIINFIKNNNIQIVDFNEVKKAVLNNIEGKDKTLIIDSRNKSNYESGHIPTALNYDYSDIDKLKVDKNQKIIVYCRGYDCGSAAIFSKELMNAGYKNVKTYLGGMPEWKKRFFKESTNKDIVDGVNKANAFFIDVRSKNEYLRSTIPYSVWISFKDFDKKKGMLPIDKNQKIIVFGRDRKDKRAFKEAWKIYDLGYKNVVYYKEGIKGYEKEHLPITMSVMM